MLELVGADLDAAQRPDDEATLRAARLEVEGVPPVSAILAVLRVTSCDRERLLKLAREIDQPAWWELGRDLPEQLTALIDAERRATHITDATLNLLPGLLQTRSYTRAVMEACGVTPQDADDMVSIRQVRQGILSNHDPTTLHCFIDETTLTRPIGGPRVMVEQLRHILSASKAENVSVQVLPLELGAHAGLAGTFILLDFVKARPVVYLEARSSGAFLDEPDDVALFQDAIERLTKVAVDPVESGKIIGEYLKQYEGRKAVASKSATDRPSSASATPKTATTP